MNPLSPFLDLRSLLISCFPTEPYQSLRHVFGMTYHLNSTPFLRLHRLEPCAGRAARRRRQFVGRLLLIGAPPPPPSADNLSARRRYHCCCVVIFWNFR